MSEQAPGRARGRGRGRGRSRGAAGQEARRPGEAVPHPASGETQLVGRGRGRAAVGGPPTTQQPPPQAQPPPRQAPSQAPRQPQGQAPSQPPTKQMAQMAINGSGATPTPSATGGAPSRDRRDPVIEPRTRPEHIQDKRGASGQTISVVSNFVTLRNRPDCALYQYQVTYSPQLESKRLRIALIASNEATLGKIRAFDGMILYLPHRLPDNETKLVATLLRDQTQVTITITLTNELHASSPICLQLFNIIFRRILTKLNMQQIGRHYYSPDIPAKIPQHKLELWPGFITSILQYENNVMLCADISHKILRTDTVYDLLRELQQRSRNFHEQALKTLVGEIVLTRYNNKTYRIDDIQWDSSPRSTFSTSAGDVSFVDYYKRNYSVDIQDMGQPLLMSQPKKKEIRAKGGDTGPILLIPELCTRTGLSEEARADFRVMKDIAVYTRVSPMERTKTLLKFIRRINEVPESKEILDGWNLEFDQKLVSFNARVLPPEKIHQRTKGFNYDPRNADWSREMRGNPLISTVNLDDYMIVFIQRDSESAKDFQSCLERVGGPMGISVNKGKLIQCSDDRTNTMLKVIENNLSPTTQIVIVILPTNKKDRYDAIKKFCCVDHPVPSQCLLSRTLSKKQMLMSVTTKVAMQLNCKLGGELWAVEIPLKNSMVIGIDSYHDSAQRGRSVGAFIASTNQTLTKYYSQCMFQHTGQELADNLKECMARALRRYHDINKTLPGRIVVYRDGVGDGQLPAVVEHEVPQMIQSFASQGGGTYKPKFAVVVVKKRINTRIFHELRGQLQNPPPGTIADTEITKPEWYDFFLVSQSVRQGTVTPTHFNVICDTTGLQPDHIQRLTYKLCHLYYNWPGTVRVPAPCQYAHKLAFLVGQSIHKQPSDLLADRLYFL